MIDKELRETFALVMRTMAKHHSLDPIRQDIWAQFYRATCADDDQAKERLMRTIIEASGIKL